MCVTLYADEMFTLFGTAADSLSTQHKLVFVGNDTLRGSTHAECECILLMFAAHE